jgi:hypothetical protein
MEIVMDMVEALQNRPSTLLRDALLADAAISGGTGLLMAAAAAPLEQLLAIPSTLLFYAGVSLLPFAALVAWLGTRERPGRLAIWAVIIVNALWVIDSVLLLASGWLEPAPLGTAFIAVQAVVVALFAELQYVALRLEAGEAIPKEFQ